MRGAGGVCFGGWGHVRPVGQRREEPVGARDRYELDPLAIVRAERAAREAGLDVVGFWHSHPDHPAEPSRLDTERAWADYLYVIVSTSSSGAGAVRGWRLGDGGFGEVELALGDAAGAEAGR